jgi:dTMP kinase
VRGLFVSFEGGEGSGKSTQIERLAARLREQGLDPLRTREPGGTPLGERVREVLLDRTLEPAPVTEALLMEAARAEIVARVIGPALDAGKIVLCDRFIHSTLAYQGGGRGLDPALLESLNRVATGGLTPDLVLLFDVDPAVGLSRRERAGGAPNRLDRESLEFHQRVRNRYLELARREPERFLVLDASRSPDELERHIWEAVFPRVGTTSR